jgi:hypothetical protein
MEKKKSYLGALTPYLLFLPFCLVQPQLVFLINSFMELGAFLLFHRNRLFSLILITLGLCTIVLCATFQ